MERIEWIILLSACCYDLFFVAVNECKNINV